MKSAAEGVDRKVNSTPRRFVVGLLEDSEFGAASAAIRAAMEQARRGNPRDKVVLEGRSLRECRQYRGQR